MESSGLTRGTSDPISKNEDSIKSQVSVSVAPILRELGLEYGLSPGVQDQLGSTVKTLFQKEKRKEATGQHVLSNLSLRLLSPSTALSWSSKRNDDRYFKDDLLETLWGKGATNQLSCGVKNFWNSSAGMNLSVCSNPCLSI